MIKLNEILTEATKLPFHLYVLWILWLAVGTFLLYYTFRLPRREAPTEVVDPNPVAPTPSPRVPSGPGPSQPQPLPWQPVPKSRQGGSEWLAWRIKSPDNKGGSAEFEIYICSQEFTWRYRSWQVTELNGQEEDLRLHLHTPGLKQRLGEAKGIVVIGASSEEGSPAEELDRAEKRANRLVSWVREVVERKTEVYSLNLGKYEPGSSLTGTSPDLTKKQRGIVIVAIVRTEPGVKLQEALYAALLSKNLPFDLRKFRSFDLKPHS